MTKIQETKPVEGTLWNICTDREKRHHLKLHGFEVKQLPFPQKREDGREKQQSMICRKLFMVDKRVGIRILIDKRMRILFLFPYPYKFNNSLTEQNQEKQKQNLKNLKIQLEDEFPGLELAPIYETFWYCPKPTIHNTSNLFFPRPPYKVDSSPFSQRSGIGVIPFMSTLISHVGELNERVQLAVYIRIREISSNEARKYFEHVKTRYIKKKGYQDFQSEYDEEEVELDPFDLNHSRERELLYNWNKKLMSDSPIASKQINHIIESDKPAYIINVSYSTRFKLKENEEITDHSKHVESIGALLENESQKVVDSFRNLNIYGHNSLRYFFEDDLKDFDDIEFHREIFACNSSNQMSIFTEDMFQLDFNLTNGMKYPIPIAIHFPREKFEVPNESSYPINSSIIFGNWIKNGVVQKNIFVSTIPSELVTNILVSGTPGSGKTTLISNTTKEFAAKHPDISIMILNTAKQGEYKHYQHFKYFSFEEKEVYLFYSAIFFLDTHCTKYRIDEAYMEKVYYITARNIAQGLLGLPDWCIKYFSAAMREYHRNYHLKHPTFFKCLLPPKFEKLLWAVIDRLKKDRDLEPKQRDHLAGVLRNRIEEFVYDSQFMNKMSSPMKNGGTPHFPIWLRRILEEGEKIFLDLSECRPGVKRFVVLNILQHIDCFTKQRNYETNQLKTLIIIDEAHDLFRNLKHLDPKSDEYESQSIIGGVMETYLKEFRNRGIGILISDQDPSELFSTFLKMMKFRVLFNSDPDTVECLKLDWETQQYIMNLAPFNAVLFDYSSSHGRRVSFRTLPKSEGENK